MRIEELPNACTACGACVSECPRQCITLSLDAEGFYYPRVDHEKCSRCDRCEQVCHCLNGQEIQSEKHSYYGYSKDESIRNGGSSGGAFATLAEPVLEAGGSVYGAAFDYDALLLRHTSTDRVSLSELQKSKYIESDMGTTIAAVREDLKRGRRVLFCGTPCQTAGVRQALGEQENLLLCDFVCHGVPSAGIFRDDLKTKLRRNEKLLRLEFRPQGFAWGKDDKQLLLETTAGKTMTPFYLDAYYKGFLTANALLRRSCYACRYRETHQSDITMADFWGYRELDPSIDDGKGFSLIVAHTEKGRRAVEAMRDFELHEIDNRYSDYAFAPKDYSEGWKRRERFFTVYRPGKLKKAAKKVYMKHWRVERLRYRIKKLLHRV
ncbi:MAG: Coenzyme F420 hydrogenase/dehydrogenase, beta subunit C-terminal domain [Oscillospiraceae bacterium]|nr:Coenzyme F420 hydrogenase/dehydrogenase, beta subunit C-terminal domain [Oscillospiraceae bacterium]